MAPSAPNSSAPSSPSSRSRPACWPEHRSPTMNRHALLLAAAVLTAAVATTTPALALLSPLWQSAAEMKAILSSNEVGDALKSQDPITSVTRTGDDKYEVSNGTCTVS